MRLGIYDDVVYRVEEHAGRRRITTDRAFMLFACEVGRHFDGFVVFGRALTSTSAAEYVLPDGLELVPLPYYERLTRLGQVSRALGGTLLGMWRGLSRVDCVWVFGPHPFAPLLVLLALARRKRVVLGVRMDPTAYYQARLPTARRRTAFATAHLLELSYRWLTRKLRTTLVGPHLVPRYGGKAVLPMTVTLVRGDDVVAEPRELDWSGTIELLTIGRLEPEKNPLLLVEALARLESVRPGRYRLTWIGRGDLEAAVNRRAAVLGLNGKIDLRGYVPFGQELLELYRASHVFVHVSLTEGVPQVLVEALASGTPIVATDVGGVRALLGSDERGLLVPPNDVDALVAALVRITDEDELRAGLVALGLERARGVTVEAESERVARFLAYS
jgi:glycosyltransferase involved in cell wall biosynthesis